MNDLPKQDKVTELPIDNQKSPIDPIDVDTEDPVPEYLKAEPEHFTPEIDEQKYVDGILNPSNDNFEWDEELGMKVPKI